MRATLPDVPPYDQRRMEHIGCLMEFIGPMIERIEWAPERVEAYRTEQLQALIHHAQARSPWHAKRLARLDADSVSALDLAKIPPMTKADLMAHWDEIVTDSRLSLSRCEDHLDGLKDPAYLKNEFHAVSSGGSSGIRGVFVYGWEEWAIIYASNLCWVMRGLAARGGVPQDELVVAIVGAEALTHVTVACSRTFQLPGSRSALFPVNLPVSEIVTGLNAHQPNVVYGYASMLNVLAGEALAGRLRIRPQLVSVTAEPLLPEIAEKMEQAWGLPPVNAYGTSDVGMVGTGCSAAPGIHLNDDLLIVEPVDAGGSPVGPGETSAKVYVTAVTHRTLPMIRYEVTDEVTLVGEPCACGSSFQRIRDIQGRLDDSFQYASGIQVHPHVFRSPLSRQRGIIEYQVRQTEQGADIAIRTDGSVEISELESEVACQLERVGLCRPTIVIREVTSLERVGIGKLKRFIPLSGATRA